ncbi:MAG: PBP1A family penicillin-binding protein [Gammaproteobacteria bacterium]|nr:PBP1A family penicillin-binding protein [Gammaproteobacteria bacterium]MCY4218710.1 PBP1A family penicillin-binding protein [Gammaproteobacteria bacterium]
MKSLLIICLYSVIFLATMGIGLGLYAITLLEDLPTIEEIREIPLNIPLRVYTSDNKMIAEYGVERRIPITLDETPQLLLDAILVTEDDRFYHHTGVDFPGLVRASISNILTKSRGQGASTITMQVARNVFLNPEKTYIRKLKEILVAFNMERTLTKDEIFELYLNKIFLGHRAYGFAAAARVYYGEDLVNLSVPEIAMLAGLPRAPSRDNPISNPERAEERRAFVLKRLHELGRIDNFSYENALNSPITARRQVDDSELIAPYASEMARQVLYDYFGESVYERGLNVTLTINSEYQAQAEQALRDGLIAYDRRHGFRGPIGEVAIDAFEPMADIGKLKSAIQQYPSSKKITPAVVIHVEFDHFEAFVKNKDGDFLLVKVNFEDIKWARKQISTSWIGEELKSPADAVKQGDIVYLRNQKTGSEEVWSLSQLPEVSGALVSVDSNTGAILAITGGFDFFLSKFNRAVQAKRQPGSNIKPFIYSAALEHGLTPSSIVSAGPIVVEDELEGVWRPQNYSNKFFGPTRLRKALSSSLNLVSVRLLRSIGIVPAIEHLSKFGFKPEELPHHLSLSLGATEVTPLEVVSSFAVLANSGYRVTPYLIETITDSANNPISLPDSNCLGCEQDEAQENPEEDKNPTQIGPQPAKQVLSPENVFLMQSMLQSVITDGTGRKALSLNRSDLAGKTGTTNNFRDAWFSGFIPDVTTTVFVGFDIPEFLGSRESGATAALPIWIHYMKKIIEDYPEEIYQRPETIISRFINKDTGRITNLDDPDGYQEYFVRGTEPTNLPNAGDPLDVSENLF